MLTASKAAQQLSYDPETGVFRWLQKRNNRSLAGSVAGGINSGGYRNIALLGKCYRAGRLAVLMMTGEWPPQEVDHIDGVRDNDRWSNIRLASRTLNNRKKSRARVDSASGVLGVTASRGRWKAVIEANGKSRHIGLFDTIEAASAAYRAAKAQRDLECC